VTVVSTAIWIVAAFLANGLVFRWLGGFDSAGRAIGRWGDSRARKWAQRRGLKGYEAP
jgi:hypothetical protein